METGESLGTNLCHGSYEDERLNKNQKTTQQVLLRWPALTTTLRKGAEGEMHTTGRTNAFYSTARYRRSREHLTKRSESERGGSAKGSRMGLRSTAKESGYFFLTRGRTSNWRNRASRGADICFAYDGKKQRRVTGAVRRVLKY